MTTTLSKTPAATRIVALAVVAAGLALTGAGATTARALTSRPSAATSGKVAGSHCTPAPNGTYNARVGMLGKTFHNYAGSEPEGCHIGVWLAGPPWRHERAQLLAAAKTARVEFHSVPRSHHQLNRVMNRVSADVRSLVDQGVDIVEWYPQFTTGFVLATVHDPTQAQRDLIHQTVGRGVRIKNGTNTSDIGMP